MERKVLLAKKGKVHSSSPWEERSIARRGMELKGTNLKDPEKQPHELVKVKVLNFHTAMQNSEYSDSCIQAEKIQQLHFYLVGLFWISHEVIRINHVFDPIR